MLPRDLSGATMAFLQYLSIWPAFACTAILLLFALSPLLTTADIPPTQPRNRRVALDGLRGFLALAVFYNHAIVYQLFLRDGVWAVPPSRFYNGLAALGVSMFFMITGYLFWSKLVAAEGRVAWMELYAGRVFRIGPLYLLAVAIVFLIVFTGTGPRLQVPATTLARQIATWLSLGLLYGRALNGYDRPDLLLAGVTWTIQVEWIFYLLLRVLALACRRRDLPLPFAITGCVLCLGRMALSPVRAISPSTASIGACFAFGMIWASCEARGWFNGRTSGSRSACLLALLAAFSLFPTPYSCVPQLLLGLAFGLVVAGCNAFGLLESRAAIRLGDVSYGIYLLQGLALVAFFRPPFLRRFALSSPSAYWTLVLVSGVALVSAAGLGHIAVEVPGRTLGKRLIARVHGHRGPGSQAA